MEILFQVDFGIFLVPTSSCYLAAVFLGQRTQ